MLWPAALHCTLVRTALKGLYRPVWTEAILHEMATALRREGRVQPERIARTVALMKAALPQALVDGYEDLIPVMQNDQKDRHVLAAAVRAGAETIVTSNGRDFPETSRALYSIDLHTPDEFLLDLWDLNALTIVQVLTEQAAALASPPLTAAEVLAGMESIVLGFVAAIRSSGLLGYSRATDVPRILRESHAAPQLARW